MEQEFFQWQDYLILAVILSISAAIGFYYAFTGGRQRTTKEYLFADMDMHWLPVSCSLVASYISALTMVSTPGEIYTYGTVLIYLALLYPFGIVIASNFYLPVFQKMGMVSIYKYIEQRFGKWVKGLVALASILNTLMYCGLVIYGPALSVSAVTGINIWAAILTVLLISTLYTIMGGMKAVLWTDTLQLLIMFAGLFTVFIYGTIQAGGVADIYRVSRESGRLDLLEPRKFLAVDPRVRHTIWNMAINSILASVTNYGTSQVSVMRFLSLREDHRTKSYLATSGISLVFNIVSASMGLIIFAMFRYCDPIADGVIISKDQYYPLFVMRMFGHLPGLPGFILSAIFSGSLSTLSSLQSAGATIIMEDGIRPWRPNISDKNATTITKILAVVIGSLSIAAVLFAMNFGQSIISLMLTVTGVFQGPSFALFTMGIFLPFITKRGALIGFVLGTAWGGLLGLGGVVNGGGYAYKYPVTTAGCNMTDSLMYTNITSPVYDPDSYKPHDHYRKGFDAIFDVSYAWVHISSIFITVLFACITSAIFNCIDKKPEKVDHVLISPHILRCRWLPKSWKIRIEYSDNDEQANHLQDMTNSHWDEKDIAL